MWPKAKTDDGLFARMQEAFYGKELILADRDMVETESDEILRDADKEDISLLVVGDPFGCVPPSSPLIPPLNIARCRQRNDAHRHHPSCP